MTDTCRYFRRFTCWIAIVFVAMLCTLLLLMAIFPVRFVSADKLSGMAMFHNVDTNVAFPMISGSSGQPKKEQIERYMEWKRQYLQKLIEKQICDYCDRYIIESMKDSGTGVYVTDLSSGRYLFIVVGKRVVLKVKIG